MSKKVRIRESVIEEKADVCFLVRAALQTSVYASAFSLNVAFLRVLPGHPGAPPLLNIHPLGRFLRGMGPCPSCLSLSPSTQRLPGDPAPRQCPR